MALKLKEANLGSVASGATLTIETPAAQGFFATGRLERDTKPVVSWESDELCGETVQRRLPVAGQYTLRISIAFVSNSEIAVALKLGAEDDNGNGATKTVSFTGKKGDIARAKGFITVSGAS
jgi:hypothetical protein